MLIKDPQRETFSQTFGSSLSLLVSNSNRRKKKRLQPQSAHFPQLLASLLETWPKASKTLLREVIQDGRQNTNSILQNSQDTLLPSQARTRILQPLQRRSTSNTSNNQSYKTRKVSIILMQSMTLTILTQTQLLLSQTSLLLPLKTLQIQFLPEEEPLEEACKDTKATSTLCTQGQQARKTCFLVETPSTTTSISSTTSCRLETSKKKVLARSLETLHLKNSHSTTQPHSQASLKTLQASTTEKTSLTSKFSTTFL